MMLNINKIHWPVTVLGYGKRIGIWFQGCSIGCKGCVSQDTWDKTAGAEISIAQLMHWCEEVTDNQLDGITISGGEPFDQPQQLSALLDAFHQWRQQLSVKVDILCYSGYPLRVLEKSYPDILAKLDVLIPEPYVNNTETIPLRGSGNQAVIPLSELGRQRYNASAIAKLSSKRFQIQLDEQRIWFIGIPERDDMRAVEALCAQKGLNFEGVSWRT